MKLTLIQKDDLLTLEKEIEGAREYFYVRVGPALLQIRNQELWKDDYESFDDYCKKRWGWTRSTADRLIVASETVKSLPPNVQGLLTTEGAIRELAPVPQDKREEVVAVAASNGEVTGPSIRKAAQSVARPEVAEPEKPVDVTGREIHPTILGLWNRRNNLMPLASELSRIKCQIEEGWEAKDDLYEQVHKDFLSRIKMAYYYIVSSKYEYVCAYCQGKCKVTEQECPPCRNTGLMTKLYWDRVVPESLKKGLK
jgi:hypothetical protein